MVLNEPGFVNGVIILEEPNAVYYSGQMLSGNLHFKLNESLNFSAINVKYLGEALVQRKEVQYEMSGGNNRSREVNYVGREQYFNFVQCLCGGLGMSSLPPGVHAIPFQFQIPLNIPSSFKGEDGIICYSVTAYLEYPEPGHRQQLDKEFKVVAPLIPDTNLMRPLELELEDIETCNCFCASKPIDLKIVLPSAALHAGTSVPVNVKLRNDSSVEIYDICFKITKRHTYRTQQPRSEYSTPEETLVELKKGPILSDTRREYIWYLPLPLVVPPNLKFCSIIDVVYYFKVKIRMTGCNDSVEDESEIFIGVLPLSDASVTSPDLASQLPIASIPEPKDSVGLVTSGNNYPVNNQIPPQFGPPIEPPPSKSAQIPPYEIGFKTTTIENHSSTDHINSCYPYPGYPSHNLNSSQPNLAFVPSAPPL